MKKLLSLILVMATLVSVLILPSCEDKPAPNIEADYYVAPGSTLVTLGTVEEECPDFLKEAVLSPASDFPQIDQYYDRLPAEHKAWRNERLSERQKEVYDFLLPYFITFTPFRIDYTNMDQEMFDEYDGACYGIYRDYWESGLFLNFYQSEETINGEKYLLNIGYIGGQHTDAMIKELESELGLTFPTKKEAVHYYMEYINTECEKIIEEMPRRLNTREKYQWLAEYICDLTTRGASFHVNPYPVSLFTKGISGCTAYAIVFEILCEKAGLWCIFDRGNLSGHAHYWNIVQLDDGLTYYMDIARQDELYDKDLSDEPYYYFVVYENFKKTILETSINNPENWVVTGK